MPVNPNSVDEVARDLEAAFKDDAAPPMRAIAQALVDLHRIANAQSIIAGIDARPVVPANILGPNGSQKQD